MHATSALDDHGRALTTVATAAEWYREAQRVAWDAVAAIAALQRAIEVDPTFPVATADLDALTGASTSVSRSARMTTWERHHIEIVTTAARGGSDRAASLLREHVSEVGCDPLALRIVHDALADPNAVADLLAERPPCHLAR
jgi:hypothetical protein